MSMPPRRVISKASLDLIRLVVEYTPQRPWTKRLPRRRRLKALELTDESFRRIYRLRRKQFDDVLCRIKPFLRKKRHARQVLSDRRLLLAFLDFIGHGTSFRKLSQDYELSPSAISTLFPRVAWAIAEAFDNIRFPRTEEELRQESRNWSHRYGFLDNCICASDGTHIPFTPTDFPKQLRRFRNRKGFTSMNCLATCSHDRTIVDLVTGAEGSLHDAFVLEQSKLTARIPPGYFGLFDSAGPLRAFRWLTPVKGTAYHLDNFRRRGGPRADNDLEVFNYVHASHRARIEQCFGILKSRFRLLLKGMTCKLSSAKLYIRACATLHNYLLRAGEEAVPLEGYEDDVDDNDDDDIQPGGHAEATGAVNEAARQWQATLVAQAGNQYRARFDDGAL